MPPTGGPGRRSTGQHGGGVHGPAAAAVSISVVSSTAALLDLRDDWNRLLAKSASNSLFLTWEWIATWWQVYGRGRLHVLEARTPDGTLVGLAPLHIEDRKAFGLRRWRAATFIGHGGDVTSEYLDFIVDAEGGDGAVDAFMDHLLADKAIDEIDLRPFASESAVLGRVFDRLRAAKGVVIHQSMSRCPVAVLPASREEFLAGRSKNYRKKVGEYERRSERTYAPTLRRSATEAEVIRDLGHLRRLHLDRWAGSSQAFQSPEYVKFHEQFAVRMLERGALRLFSLESSGRPLAMSYCLHYGDRYYFYQAGRDPSLHQERVGLVLMHRVLQEAIADGARVFDFLTGREPYKYRWATGETGSDSVTFWKRRSMYLTVSARRVVRVLRLLPSRWV